MRYIISDIHGCYEEYQELLGRLRFSPADELYVCWGMLRTEDRSL